MKIYFSDETHLESYLICWERSLCIFVCFVLFVEENDDGIYCWKLNRVLFCERNGILLVFLFVFVLSNANCIGYLSDYSYGSDKSCLS